MASSEGMARERRVKVTAAGNGNYKKGTKTVTVRIKVK